MGARTINQIPVFCPRTYSTVVHKLHCNTPNVTIDRTDLLAGHICADINTLWHLGNFYLESTLHLFQYLAVIFAAHERNGQTLGTESARATNPMQVLIGFVRHIVVDNDVDALEVDTTTEHIGGYQYSALILLEFIVFLQSFLLVHPAIDDGGREIALAQQLVQLLGTTYTVDEYDDLIELERIQQIVQLTVLSRLGQLDVVLLQAVQSQLTLIVHVDLSRLHSIANTSIVR